jgi:hypothetical protein
MKAYNSKLFIYLYLLFVTLPCTAGLIFLLTRGENTEDPMLFILAEAVLAVAITLMVAAAIYRHFLPSVILEVTDEVLTVYKAKTQTAYKLADISKIRICTNNAWTIRFTVYCGKKSTNIELHAKDTAGTRLTLINLLMDYGIDVELYSERYEIGD